MTPRRQPIIGSALLLLGALCCALPAVAADPAPARPAASAGAASRAWLRPEPAQKRAKPPESSSSLRIALAGGLVTALGVFALLRRRRQRGGVRSARAGLEVVSSTRIGLKAELVVVDVGGRKLLLGVTEAEVSRIAWLDGESESEALESDNELYTARTAAGALTAGVDEFASALEPTPAPVKPARAPTKRVQEPPRRFRDALLGALGQGKPKVEESAADILAEATRDVVVSRNAGAQVAAPAGAPAMVDVEGQAKGLVLRLQKRA